MTVVEFPGLGLTFNVNRVAFSIFGLDIYWYGIFIGVGMALALLLAFRLAKSFGVDADRMIDVIFVGLVCAIIFGRAYYVIFVDQRYRTFYELIDLRSGGIAIYGAIIGAFLGAGITCKLRKVPVGPLFDLAGMGFLIGQALGRWGNFTNQEAFGVNTNLPWGMYSSATHDYLAWNQARLAADGMVVDPTLPVHPTFLYESLWCILGFLLLFLYRRKRKFNGELFLFYVIWYGIGRFFIEGLRTDSLWGFGLRVSQALAAVSVLVAGALWIVARVKTAGKPLVVPAIPPHTAKVKVPVSGGVETVTISWPAGDKEPSREQRMEMAKKQLAEKDESKGGKPAEAAKPEKATEKPAAKAEEKEEARDGSEAD